MADVVQGPVTRVVDGDTFEMQVARVGTFNLGTYSRIETIRLAGVDAPEMRTPAGVRAKITLEAKLNGRTVHCTVQARDVYGRLVCRVQVI